MPCIEDWVSHPLNVIDGICKENGATTSDEVKEYFTERVHEAGHRIPSLNDISVDKLRSNSLVKFRCMVQDMFGPEYYLSEYECVSKSDGKTAMRSGKYRDMADCPLGYEVNFESTKNVTTEKHTFYCVPIPGETEWAKDGFAGKSARVQRGTGQTTSCKRALEDEDDMHDHVPVVMDEVMETAEHDGNPKRTKENNDVSQGPCGSSPMASSLNHPLPEEQGSPCIVHIYDKSEDIKLNDMVEFIGVVSIQPNFASFPEKKSDEMVDLSADNFMTEEEQAAHYPPTSLVPRIHCVLFQHMKHSNPCIPPEINEKKAASCLFEAVKLREDLISVLKSVLLGDALAAEYLLLHLVSSVYTRCGIMAVGQFALNVCGCPTQLGLPKQVAETLKALLPKCVYLPMNLDNLNSLSFVPKKDYTANRLMSGILQLSDSTELILDEIAMEAGNLNPGGVQNVTALGTLISWQKLEYDFNFYKTDFQSNVQVLVLSEGKSMLPCDCHVKIQGPWTMSENVVSCLSLQDLEKFRMYLGLVRCCAYSVSADMQNTLQEDFVQARQVNPSNMTADDFHMHLLVARLMALSCGSGSLTPELWEKVKHMESMRKVRLPSTQ
ncbi:hypothetical protein QZH41_015771 [Actinostola sp. cb2023]|nr:hypothetical protein QZH41_015771 [Actinostola sp. cb2023]